MFRRIALLLTTCHLSCITFLSRMRVGIYTYDVYFFLIVFSSCARRRKRQSYATKVAGCQAKVLLYVAKALY